MRFTLSLLAMLFIAFAAPPPASAQAGRPLPIPVANPRDLPSTTRREPVQSFEIVNAASYEPTVSPYAVATLFGKRMHEVTQVVLEFSEEITPGFYARYFTTEAKITFKDNDQVNLLLPNFEPARPLPASQPGTFVRLSAFADDKGHLELVGEQTLVLENLAPALFDTGEVWNAPGPHTLILTGALPAHPCTRAAPRFKLLGSGLSDAREIPIADLTDDFGAPGTQRLGLNLDRLPPAGNYLGHLVVTDCAGHRIDSNSIPIRVTP